LTFDLLTLKVVSKSRMTWATSVPILAFLGLSILDLGDRTRCRTTVMPKIPSSGNSTHMQFLVNSDKK